MSARRPAIRLTQRAKRDIENILLYTRRTWGAEQTATYRRAITRLWALLRAHPQLGQPREDLFPGCREIKLEQHVVFYQPLASEITVVRILHSLQDPTGKVEKPRS